MNPDNLNPSTLSIIFPWLFTIGILVLFLMAIFSQLLTIYVSTSDLMSYTFNTWLTICILVISPIRYMILQVIIWFSLPFQSWHSLFLTLIWLIPNSLIFGFLVFIGFFAPYFIVLHISGLNKHSYVPNIRLIITMFVTPIIFFIFTYIYLLVHPIQYFTTNKYSVTDFIRAANGPGLVYYETVGSLFLPIHTPVFVPELKPNLKVFYHLHIASTYMTREKEMYFYYNYYPEIYNKYYK